MVSVHALRVKTKHANTLDLVIMKDRVEDAFVSYTSTRAAAESDGANEAQDQFNLMHAQIVHERNNAKSFVDLFTHPTLRYRCMVGFLTLFAGQATGTQVINSRS